jgi:hypothetical protein
MSTSQSIRFSLAAGLLFWLGGQVQPAPHDAVDRLGVRQLFQTCSGGREWYARWEAERSIPPFQVDAQDPLCRNSYGVLKIKDGTATFAPDQSRLYILTPKDTAGQYNAPRWRNVEITVYARRGRSTQTPSYQAFDLSARSGEHHDDRMPCEGTSYHAAVRFDGLCGFKKEVWHTGGYTQLAPVPTPRPWPTVPEGRWIGIKFVCRNVDRDQHVNLRLYLDPEQRNEWRQVAELTDAGGWKGGAEGCSRPTDFILKDAYPAVYFRTDYVAAEIKQFSVREIDPLP